MYYTSEEENYRKYGIVILEVYDETLRATIYHYRKPTPSERKEIILNYIIDNSGTPIKVNYLSYKLAVSDRTIQKIIKELANEGLIKVEPCFINERQFGNKIIYISEPRIRTGKELTLDLLYNINNPYGFIDWDLMDFKLHPDLDLEEKINQFEILKDHKEEHIIVRNTHEPIISRSDFEHVQELIRHRQRPSRHNHPNLFKGILRCKNCGRPLNLYYNKRRSGKMVWRYRCVGNFVKYGLDDKPNTIGYLEIYGIVKSKLKELMTSLKLNSDEFINNIVNKVDTDEHIKVLVSEKNKIVTRLNTIDSIIIRLYEDLI